MQACLAVTASGIASSSPTPPLQPALFFRFSSYLSSPFPSLSFFSLSPFHFPFPSLLLGVVWRAAATPLKEGTGAGKGGIPTTSDYLRSRM